MNKKILSLLDQYNKETLYISSLSQMQTTPSFLGLLHIGQPTIPLILKKIRTQPDVSLCILLEKIINKIPFTIEENEKGNVTEICKKWIKWGKENFYIK